MRSSAGGGSATLSDVSILSERTNAGIDILFGNLGQDFVDGFERVTLDFGINEFVGVRRLSSSRALVIAPMPIENQSLHLCVIAARYGNVYRPGTSCL